jgi:hypothetical protein
VNVYSAGELVYELVSPDDDAFVMQSSTMPPDELATLGERLTLAEGWEFQSRTFDEELALAMDEKVKGAMDDLRNVYNMSPQAREPEE